MQLADQFLAQLRFAYPLHFESGDELFPYYCGGSCFAAKFQDRLFIITAKHCLRGKVGDPCIPGPGGKTFPLRQQFTPVCEEDDSAWSDVMCFSTYDCELWPPLSPFNTLDLGLHMETHIWADHSSFLVIWGYPSSHTEIDPPKILRKPSFHIGLYGGPTNDHDCHYFKVLHPVHENLDGLSGSPVLKIDFDTGSVPVPTLVGVVTQANKDLIRFVGVGVILRMLCEMVKES